MQIGETDATSEFLLRCLKWSYMPPAAPVLWTAQLANVTELPGNLAIQRRISNQINASSGHLRLQRPGLTTYFIVTKERTPTGDVWISFDGEPSMSHRNPHCTSQ